MKHLTSHPETILELKQYLPDAVWRDDVILINQLTSSVNLQDKNTKLELQKSLALAIIGDKVLAMQFFLQKNIKPAIKFVEFLDKDFLHSKGFNRDEIAQLFLEAYKANFGSSFKEDMHSSLTYDACWTGNLDLAKKILYYYKLTGVKQEFKAEVSRAILVAASCEHLNIVKELLLIRAIKEVAVDGLLRVSDYDNSPASAQKYGEILDKLDLAEREVNSIFDPYFSSEIRVIIMGYADGIFEFSD